MSSPRPSWRPLLAGTIALFLIILAFLAGQVKAGGDPAIGGGNTTTRESTPAAPGQGTPAGPDDGFVPGGSAPAPSVPDSSDPPTTQQS